MAGCGEKPTPPPSHHDNGIANLYFSMHNYAFLILQAFLNFRTKNIMQECYLLLNTLNNQVWANSAIAIGCRATHKFFVFRFFSKKPVRGKNLLTT